MTVSPLINDIADRSLVAYASGQAIPQFSPEVGVINVDAAYEIQSVVTAKWPSC